MLATYRLRPAFLDEEPLDEDPLNKESLDEEPLDEESFKQGTPAASRVASC